MTAARRGRRPARRDERPEYRVRLDHCQGASAGRLVLDRARVVPHVAQTHTTGAFCGGGQPGVLNPPIRTHPRQ